MHILEVPTVCLMLKAPIPGQVKTRLAASIGAEHAARIYRRLVEHQLANIPHRWQIHVCFSPVDALSEMREWLGPKLQYSPQAKGDLGERLVHAVDSVFRSGCKRLIVIGGDCPYLDESTLAQAAKELAKADAVLIPALDGGYCLIGVKAPHPEIFRDIDWSTGVVCAQTEAKIAQAGLTLIILNPPLEDVDDVESWRRAERVVHSQLPE